jgi:hypothetical protein
MGLVYDSEASVWRTSLKGRVIITDDNAVILLLNNADLSLQEASNYFAEGVSREEVEYYYHSKGLGIPFQTCSFDREVKLSYDNTKDHQVLACPVCGSIRTFLWPHQLELWKEKLGS